MATTQPIRSTKDIDRFKNYFLERGQLRNYCLVTVALNTALRVGDLLSLRWGDVYDFSRKAVRRHLSVVEQKTGKTNVVAINREAASALKLLRDSAAPVAPDGFIFASRNGDNRPIGRVCAFRIIKNAAADLGIEGVISCHSLRKTFGYHAWKKGVPPAVIMNIYNHSSIEVTKRYLSIDQDDRDAVFDGMNL